MILTTTNDDTENKMSCENNIIARKQFGDMEMNKNSRMQQKTCKACVEKMGNSNSTYSK